MFEYLLFCVLFGNVIATSMLWMHHNALRRTTLKTIEEKRRELLEHRDRLRGDILEVCESMWMHPHDWALTHNGAMHRSGLSIATVGTESVYIRSPLPDHNLNPYEQRELIQALRHIQATQMRAFLFGECDSVTDADVMQPALPEHAPPPPLRSEVGVVEGPR